MGSFTLLRTSREIHLDLPKALDELALSLRHYTVNREEERPDVHLRIVAGAAAHIDVSEESLTLHAPLDLLNREALQTMSDLAYYRALDADGIVIVHAAVVSDGRRTFALWGASGAGKTTTAMALRELRGFSVLSNGTAMFRHVGGRPVFVGSAKDHVKLRASSVTQSRLPGLHEFESSASSNYENKVESDLASLVAGDVSPPLPLTAFVKIRLVRDLPVAELLPLDHHRTGVELYEDSVRHLHGLTAVLIGSDGRRLARLPVFDDDAAHDRRRALIGDFVDMGYALSGPLDEVVTILDDLNGVDSRC